MILCSFLNNKNFTNSYVYAWKSFDNKKNIQNYGTSIDSFFLFLKMQKKGCVIYVNNLNDAGIAFFYFLLQNCKYDIECNKEYTFSSIINQDRRILSITLKLNDNKTYQFKDTRNIFNFSYDKTLLKLKLDDLYYEYSELITFNECTFFEKNQKITNDCKRILDIECNVLNTVITQVKELIGRSNTIAGAAFNGYCKTISKTDYYKLHPKLNDLTYRFIKRAYIGGACMVKNKYKNIELDEGYTFDVNSLYASVMIDNIMPYDTPKYFHGRYIQNDDYPVAIQKVVLSCKLKDGYLPCLIKNSIFNTDNFRDFVTDTENHFIYAWLTNSELEMIYEHYHIHSIKYIEGICFKGAKGIFDDYLKKICEIKEEASKNDKPVLKSTCKMLLATLSGKFGTNIDKKNYLPKISSNGLIDFTDTINYTDIDSQKYIPVACFTTSYARQFIIKKAQKNYNDFIYMDTDSLHLLKNDNYNDLYFDNHKIGAFKLEFEFKKARYLKEKCYIQVDHNNNQKVVCAGLSENARDVIDFDNFYLNNKNLKIKQTKIMPGLYGSVNKDFEYTLNFDL